jgi:hypothetical protein
LSIPDHEMRPYDRALDRQWVEESFRHGLCTPREHHCRSGKPIRDILRRGDTTCVMAHHPGEPRELYGWCAVTGGALAWVYVRTLYHSLRRQGLGTALMLAAGADPSQPTPCLYWSPYATILASRGYRLYPAPQNERTAA